MIFQNGLTDIVSSKKRIGYPFKTITGAFFRIATIIMLGISTIDTLAFAQEKKISLSGHKEDVVTVAFSPDSKLFATGSLDRTVKLWDAVTGRERVTFLGHKGWVKSVAFSPDGSMLASGSADKTAKLWDVATNRERAALLGHSDVLSSVAYSPDGKTLATGSWDGTIRLWNLATLSEQAILKEANGQVNCLAFSPDGKTLAAGNGGLFSETGEVKLWDVTTRRVWATLKGHKGQVLAIAFGSKGKIVVSGGWDKHVRRWDLATMKEQTKYLMDTDVVTCVALAPNDKVLAAGGSFFDKSPELKFWDVNSGQERKGLIEGTSRVNSIAFSPCGKMFAKAKGKDVDLYLADEKK